MVFFFHRIDAGARESGNTVRQQIYKYLENRLPFTRQTISGKIKKIRIEKEEEKLNKMQRDLSDRIHQWEAMSIPLYEAELKKIDELRAQASREAALRGLDKPEQIYKNPPKRFLWNDALRYNISFLA